MEVDALLEHMARDARARPAAPRGGDPLPPPRGLLGERDGRLEGPARSGSLELGPRMASFRGISHCYQRPTYEDWPYSVFTMAHGRSKEECDAILDAIAEQTGHRGARHAVLLDRVQEDPPAVLHRRLQAVGRPARLRAGGPPTPTPPPVTASLTDTRSAELYRRALKVLPGGVNSPVRAMRAIGRDPVFIERGAGAELVDVDGNRYVDYVCSWGPLIHGHAHPEIARGGARGGASGARASARRRRARSSSPRRWRGGCRAVDMLRMTSSGTEATMTALRLARAATGRERIVKFAGAYHGHVDGLLAQAGSGLATQAIPASPGVPAGVGGGDGGGAVERPARRWSRRCAGTSRRRSWPSRSPPTWASCRRARASWSCCASRPTRAGRCWYSTR